MIKSRQKTFSQMIGIEPHKLVEWVVFGVSTVENTPDMLYASRHYLTVYLLSKFMGLDAVSDVLQVSVQRCKKRMGYAQFELARTSDEKKLEIFHIVACINHEIEIMKLRA